MMAHFAELDENDLVLRVVVISDSDIRDENGNESEEIGIEFCKRLWGENTRWVQTSYNANIRKNYAGIGDKFDRVKDGFVRKSPSAHWILNEDKLIYEIPALEPEFDENFSHHWNEDKQSWDKVPRSEDDKVLIKEKKSKEKKDKP